VLKYKKILTLLCKSSENVTKKCSKEYDDEGTNLNINILKQGTIVSLWLSIQVSS
jgi:hypothetical protein